MRAHFLKRKTLMSVDKNCLSEFDLQYLLGEVAEIRKENLFLDPSVASEYARINMNIARMMEIKRLAQEHLKSIDVKKRHLRVI